MIGLKVKFDKDGASLLTDEQVEDTDATIQAALINIATPVGSDPAHPERGTDLLRRAASGAIVSPQEAAHAANFAAVDTLFFVRENEPAASDDDKLSAIDTNPLILSAQTLQVNLQFHFISGLTVGVLEPLSVNG